MKIVCTADTHMYHTDFKTIPTGDMFIHAGDFLRKGNLEELKEFSNWINSLNFKYKIVVAGNHDFCLQRDRVQSEAILGKDVIYLQDSAVCIHGIKIYGSSWQPRFYNFSFNLPRGEELAKKWQLIPNDTTILITHCPPFGYGDKPLLPGRAGCEELLKRIKVVPLKLHIFGHIHQRGGLWTMENKLLTNVTSWECERDFSIFEFDTINNIVKPIQIPPSEIDSNLA